MEGSSSPDLSSPPQSPEAPSGDNGGPNNGHPSSTANNHGGALSSLPAHASSPANATSKSKEPAPAPAPAKRQRKKKDPVIQDAPPPEEKPKRQRKPRDPNAPPVSRKRKKADTSNETEEKITAKAAKPQPQQQQQQQQQQQPPPPSQQQSQSQPQLQPQPQQQQQQQTQPQPEQQQLPIKQPIPVAPEPVPTHSRQSKITDLINQHAAPQHPQQPSQPVLVPSPRPQPITAPEVIRNQAVTAIAAPPTPRPASSGQLFDPIRSATVEPRPHGASNGPPVSPRSKVSNRASASPSINSLIDPMPMERSLTGSTLSQSSRYQQPVAPTSAPVSPAMPIRSTTASTTANPSAPPQPSNTTATTFPTPMDVDSEKEAPKKAAVPMKKSDSTGASNPSAAPTPPTKPAKPKDAPPPLPGTGSGLLSGTPLGPTLSSGSTAATGTNIWLTFPLKGQNNVTINFAREVEKKYGFAALHPRIAAQKERRRQIALAGANLEKASGANSADEMSLDLSEPESNVEMGGGEDEGSAAGAPKKRRKKKADEYDKDDDFIDDTELAWEQQALMAKDGFFVYSGPLIMEGERPAVERADGTVRRGRGRGRGGTGRGAAASGEGSGRGRGGGRGSRGGATVRKPRVTKADRAMMEHEKHEREKMAATLAAKQGQPFAAGATA